MITPYLAYARCHLYKVYLPMIGFERESRD
jgi:hypothetical protein